MSKIQGTVTISAEEYLTLLERSFDLQCLEESGVDNWEGYGEGEGRGDKEDAILLKMVQDKLNV
jgi:hypothetical protein